MTDVDILATAATRAAAIWRKAPPADRAGALLAIAEAIEAHRHELVTLAMIETGLDRARLDGELTRTTGQLALFADVVREGSFLELTVDDPDPAAVPPRPELRRMLVGVGPVAVFAASNFPFAFSVVGGDTASALAAGAPVVVKAHSGHPRLSRLTMRIAAEALAVAGAPEGTLGMVEGRAAGEALVQHPAIRAAGFTGSLAGGRALADLAAGRDDPIPFYGELGSLNPVVITRAAVRRRGDELARGLVESFTRSAGQLCTKPGVVLVPADSGFEQQVGAHASVARGAALLTPRIADAFTDTIAAVRTNPSVSVVALGIDEGPAAARPVVLSADAAAVLDRPGALLEERFGPTTLLVRYGSDDELRDVLRILPGSLTATLHSEPEDEVAAVLDLLQQLAGRVLFAGWPTGVAVTWSQHHGGPWPATNSLHTSVGATAVRRFLRPVVYQDAPVELLPPTLRDETLAALPHRRNGSLRLPV